VIHVVRKEGDIPPEWLEKARRLTGRLRQLPPDQRSDFIKSNSKMWKDLKPILQAMSSGKCWYSEAKELCSDYDVDHFRPKGPAKDMEGNVREGYWWLAFEWTNYCIVGGVCNRPHKDDDEEVRGKHDYFPLMAGSFAAASPDDDTAREMPFLLDPTDKDDPLLMTFDETGTPRAVAPEGSWVAERVRITVDLLFLDSPALVTARKRVWRRVRKKLNRVMELMATSAARFDELHRTHVRDLMAEIREMTSPTEELSATARACLEHSGIPWAMRLAHTSAEASNLEAA
jgi:hypothetical protein